MKFLFSSLRSNFTTSFIVLVIYLIRGGIFDSKAAISARTTSRIHGNAPSLITSSAENKLGFTVNGKTYNESLGNVSSTTTSLFESVTLNDFIIETPNFDEDDDYFDMDGDVADSITPFEVNSMTYSWKDAKGQIIPDSDYDKDIVCELNYPRPLSLTIVANDVKVISQYGLPSSSEQYLLTKIYKISAKNSFCYAKPNSMIIEPSKTWLNVSSGWNSGGSSANNQLGGGYTADFDPIKGFKASATTKFPTTGFTNAKFQLIMVGNQSDYSYEALESGAATSAVTVDSNGVVTLKSKPSSSVTIRAKLKSESTIHFDYSFDPTKVWALPKIGEITTVCGNSGLLTRQELTNSPKYLNTAGPGDGPGNGPGSSNAPAVNYYTRAIDSSLFSEWGVTTQETYPDSNWSKDSLSNDIWIYTQDLSKDKQRTLFVSAETGMADVNTSLGGWVGGGAPQAAVVCKG